MWTITVLPKLSYLVCFAPTTRLLFLHRSYFADDGIKYNLGRVPIGGSDFSTRKYTYADDKGVPDLNNFDLAAEDMEYKVVFVKLFKKYA